MQWWLVFATVVVGAAALAVAATTDRRRAKRLADSAAAPPSRYLPGLPNGTPAPAYVSEADAFAPPTAATVEEATALRAAIEGIDPIPAGWADAAFVTVPERRWAVAHDPLVLVCTGVGSFRELLPAVATAKRSGRSLVVVAPAIEAETVKTLAANSVQRHLPGIAIACGDSDTANRFATAAAAKVVAREDLQSGWLPESSYGNCQLWVSSETSSWVVPTLDLEPST